MLATRRTAPSGAATAGGAFVPELESLRGIAIALVVLAHLDGWFHFGQPRPPGPGVPLPFVLMYAGQTGVDLFFVLSGFLLGRPFVAAALQGKRMNLSAYYARRALRILPLYFVAVGVGAVMWAERPADLLRAFPYLLFLHGFAGMATPLGPYGGVWWSLATEVQFYLLLPLLPLFLRSARGRWLGTLVGFVYLGVYAALLSGRVHPFTLAGQGMLSLSVFGRGPLFACGIVTGWAYDQFGQRFRAWVATTTWARYGVWDLAVLAALGCLGLLLRQSVLIGVSEIDPRCAAWHVANGLLWSTVLLMLLLPPLWSHTLLCNRMWNGLGRISYSLYLVHNPLIPSSMAAFSRAQLLLPIGWNLRTFAAMTVIAGACIGVSALTYRLIERPFLQRKGSLPWWSATSTVLRTSGGPPAELAGGRLG